VRAGIVVVVAIGALAAGSGAALATPPLSVPPANAPPPAQVAAQYLGQISELKSKTMLVLCAEIPRNVASGITFMGGAIVKGNAMVLSMSAVCKPLQALWRSSPIFTGQAASSLPLNSIDAVEIVANEWFVTQGVKDETRALCKAVQYTWKWLRRSDLSPSFLEAARSHLLDQALLPSGYVITPTCLARG
jgi:hypothetical protein